MREKALQSRKHEIGEDTKWDYLTGMGRMNRIAMAEIRFPS
jgi:hypothetical protein